MGLKLPFGITEIGTVSIAAKAIDLVFVKYVRFLYVTCTGKVFRNESLKQHPIFT